MWSTRVDTCMDRDELQDWLRLTLTPGIGAEKTRRLLAAFGLPAQVLAQNHQALAEVVGPKLAQALHHPGPELQDAIDRTWQWLQTPKDHAVQPAVLTLGDPDYPASLLALEDPPPLIYLLGRMDLWRAARLNAGDGGHAFPSGAAVAVVGSRNPTPQGASHAQRFAHALAQAGVTVVSGLALGVDGAAHQGALEAQPAHPGLATLAVVGTGLDRVYPRQHRELAHRISEHGLLISEYPLGTPPLTANFPRRNRLIAGLSRATLVIEAALKSGSLITARLASEQGKDVMALPGSILSPQARGCHALIRQGARLVEAPDEVLEEIGWNATPRMSLAETASKNPKKIADNPAPARVTHQIDSENPLLRQMGHDPVSLDALVMRTGLNTAQLQTELLTLELEGQVLRLPGGRFQRAGLA